MPPDEQAALTALLRQLDFHGEELAAVETDLARIALTSPEVARLMTVPGIDAMVALSLLAAIGDFGRFRTGERIVAYLGLHPKVKQSGGAPASHGRITKQGRAQARGMMVEAAWSAAQVPGPLRAFYQRVARRRGMQIAVVALARKMTVLCWHLVVHEQDYAFAKPSLIAKKRRALELKAGLPPRRGRKGAAAAYSLKQVRAAETQAALQAEAAYRVLTDRWQPTRPERRASPPAEHGGVPTGVQATA